MDQLIELLEQIQDLAGVAVDALKEAGGEKGEKPEGEKPEGEPRREGEGGPPKPEGEGKPPMEGKAAPEGGEPPEEEGGKKPPPFGRR